MEVLDGVADGLIHAALGFAQGEFPVQVIQVLPNFITGIPLTQTRRYVFLRALELHCPSFDLLMGDGREVFKWDGIGRTGLGGGGPAWRILFRFRKRGGGGRRLSD
jgi:hypothetical protein